ncbi:hypothetical protein [Kitasatospora sp. NPDC004289]
MSREVYELWHLRHLAVEADGTVIHRDPDGYVHQDEDEWRLLGIYSSEAAAEARIAQARLLPGFRDEPDCFEVIPADVDHDTWTDGYFTYHHRPGEDT